MPNLLGGNEGAVLGKYAYYGVFSMTERIISNV